MAKSQFSCATFFALLICFLLLVPNEMPIAEAKSCQKPSKSWSGKCADKGCHNVCKSRDHADSGSCMWTGQGHQRHYACYCRYKC
nr:defensin D1-like [Coffea arabica]